MGRSSGGQQNKHHMQPEMSPDIGVSTSFFAIASCNDRCDKMGQNSLTQSKFTHFYPTQPILKNFFP